MTCVCKPGTCYHQANCRLIHSEPKQRSPRDKINRLRTRLDRIKHSEGHTQPITALIAGILDYLEDEL